MYFGTKSYLKSNRNHIVKFPNRFLIEGCFDLECCACKGITITLHIIIINYCLKQLRERTNNIE